MKRLAPGLWQHDYNNCDIVINENTHEIKVKIHDDKVIRYTFKDEPTLDDLEHIYNLIDDAYGTEIA